MIAKATEPVEPSSLSALSDRALLELLIARILEAEEILLELKVRDLRVTDLELTLGNMPAARNHDEDGNHIP
jgi:hypothetical protein